MLRETLGNIFRELIIIAVIPRTVEITIITIIPAAITAVTIAVAIIRIVAVQAAVIMVHRIVVVHQLHLAAFQTAKERQAMI